MGANLLILAGTLLLPSSQHDTTDIAEQPSHGVGYERLSDVLEYNRAQGLSVGLGYHAPLPGVRSTSGHVTVRYGASDERVTGRVSIVAEHRRGYLRLSGYSDLTDIDPISPGRTIANTINSLFGGHDNADYALSRGASLTWQTPVGSTLNLELSTSIDRWSSTARTARSAVNDFLGGTGVFPQNPPVREGTFGTAMAELSRRGRSRWMLALEVRGGTGPTVGRFWGSVLRSIGRGPGITIQLKAGIGTEPALPQTLFRLGGLQTVRGFEYGTLRAPAFWATQFDLALLPGRIRPILFLDAGQASPPGDLLSSTVLVGGGAGLSLMRGLIRFDLSHPISPDTGGKVRFDIVIQGVR
jgi:hypothetical protein